MENYFKDQLEKNTKITQEQVVKFIGKPFYDEYKVEDIICYFLEQIVNEETCIIEDEKVLKIDTKLCFTPIVDRTIDKLYEEYEFVRFAGRFPVFTKKQKR